MLQSGRRRRALASSTDGPQALRRKFTYSNNEAPSKARRQLNFLLGMKGCETLEEFKERVIQATRETGMLKDEAN